MADLAAHSTYNASYSGLLSSLWIALGVGGVCMLAHEALWRVPRKVTTTAATTTTTAAAARDGEKIDGGGGGGGEKDPSSSPSSMSSASEVVMTSGDEQRRRRRRQDPDRANEMRLGGGDVGTIIQPPQSQSQPPPDPSSVAGAVPASQLGPVITTDPQTPNPNPTSAANVNPSRAGSTASFASSLAGGASVYRTPLGTPLNGPATEGVVVGGGVGGIGDQTPVSAFATPLSSSDDRSPTMRDDDMDEKTGRHQPTVTYPPPTAAPGASRPSAASSSSPILGATWRDGSKNEEATWQRDLPLDDKRAVIDSSLGSRERWVFAYLYQNRCWNLTRPMHPLPRFPLGWLRTAWFRTSDALTAPVVGLDCTAHARFLRGTLWWILLQMCTTLVVLLPLHIRYSTLDLKSTSMLRAGLSVKDGTGASRWLWVHVVILYWVILTWVANLVWVIWGVLGLRRRQAVHRIEELRNDPNKRKLLERPGFDRYRAVMVTNIPPAMRDEQTLKEYFTTHLRGYSLGWRAELPVFLRRHLRTPGEQQKGGRRRRIRLRRVKDDGSREDVLPAESSDESRRRSEEAPPPPDFIDSITLVRRSAEIDALRKDHAKVIVQLEKAHMGLAERVIKSNESLGEELKDKPLWPALLAVERSLLDPYQAVHKGVPLIDYLTAKEQVLADRLSDALAEPFDSLKPASSAFIVFREARYARRVLRELPSHPMHTLGCQTRPAPEYADIVWPRLSRTVYRADVFKNAIVGVLVFALLVFWIFPTSAIVAIASITNLSNIFPGLANFLLRNDTASSLLDSVVPVVLVAALSLAVCPILLAIGNNLLTLPTGYDVHNFVLFRFWVFEIINTLIFFVVGKTAVQSYVYVTQINATSVLENVASAFPDAAPYYVSYLLLQTVIQSFFELLRLGLPLLFWLFSTRKAALPRIRAGRLAHSTVSWFFQVPNHCFAVTITFVFMIYNPLVIPFAFIFFVFAYTLYKHQYLWTYGRRYENDGKRNCVRYVRLTLDGLTLMEFTFLAFYILVKNKALGVLSALAMLLTILLKLGLTRIVKAKFDAIAWSEAAQMDALRLDVPLPAEEDPLPDNKFTRPFYRFAIWLLRPVDRWMQFDEPSGEWLIEPPQAPSSSSGDVVHHPYSPLWEDLPTPDRALSYAHQPVYHEPVRRYLWLPASIKGNVNLDDTVELRTYLTTSSHDGEKVGSAVTKSEVEAAKVLGEKRKGGFLGRVFGRKPKEPVIDPEATAAAAHHHHHSGRHRRESTVPPAVLDAIEADVEQTLRKTRSVEGKESRVEVERQVKAREKEGLD